MKAIGLTACGPPIERLRLAELPEPAPTPCGKRRGPFSTSGKGSTMERW